MEESIKAEEKKPKYIDIKDIRVSSLTDETFIVMEHYNYGDVGGYYEEISTEIRFISKEDLKFTIDMKRKASQRFLKESGRLEKILFGDNSNEN